MKKIISVLLIITILLSSLAGCGRQSEEKDKLSIVTTIFPLYDWVMNVLGEEASDDEVTFLQGSGVDLHSYQPTASDIMRIATCDVFVYVGGESDEWVSDALKEATNKEMKVIDLLEVLGDAVKEEEEIEGMEHDHDEDHEEGSEDHDHEEPEYDEHVWLSLKNASFVVSKLGETLGEVDPENADVYKANAADYNKKLSDLDEQYKEALKDVSFKTLLFGDRFPFRYMTDDYGLDYYAAFAGCSAETEASFETVIFLASKVDELSLPAVMTIEGSDQKIARTIIENTKSKDQKILVLDSMQSVTETDARDGASYLSIMEKNLSVLKEALR